MIAKSIVLNLDCLVEFSHLIKNKFLFLPYQIVRLQLGQE